VPGPLLLFPLDCACVGGAYGGGGSRLIGGRLIGGRLVGGRLVGGRLVGEGKLANMSAIAVFVILRFVSISISFPMNT